MSTGVGLTLSSGTYFMLIDSDFGALVAFGSSVSTGPTITSTSAQHVPANVGAIPFIAKPYGQLFVSST